MSNTFYIHSIPLTLKMSIVFYILYFVTLERHSRMSENYLSLISAFYVIPLSNSSQKNKNAKKMFGVSSEKTQPDEQLSLFHFEQELAQELFKEQKKITVKSHEKTPRKSGVREEKDWFHMGLVLTSTVLEWFRTISVLLYFACHELRC